MSANEAGVVRESFSGRRLGGRRTGLVLLLVGCLSPHWGCGGGPDDQQPLVQSANQPVLGEEAQGILNGDVDPGGLYPTVGLLATGSGSCTAFAVSPWIVMTAAHCLSFDEVSGCGNYGGYLSKNFTFIKPASTAGGTPSALKVTSTKAYVHPQFIGINVSKECLLPPSCGGFPNPNCCSDPVGVEGDICCDLGYVNCTWRGQECSGNLAGNFINKTDADIAVYKLKSPLPIDWPYAPVMVLPEDLHDSPRLAAWSGLRQWATTFPRATAVGYGTGSTSWNKDFGITRIDGLETLEPVFNGYESCIKQRPKTISTDMVRVAADFDADVILGPGEDVYGAVLSVPSFGDSGSPLLVGPGPATARGASPSPLPDPDAGDRYEPSKQYVVGVDSFVGLGKVRYYALTASQTNSATIADMLLDTDGDDVPDWADNCPTVPNFFQKDSDKNGYGDACDCPTKAMGGPQWCETDLDCGLTPWGQPNRCVPDDPSGIYLGKRCWEPPSHDADGLPDACDSCPFTNNAGDADANDNGYGDSCDCAQSFIKELVPCVDDADCGLTPSGKPNRCARKDAGSNTGKVCLEPPSHDDDGLPDACDNCPLTANSDQAKVGGVFGSVCDCPGAQHAVFELCLAGQADCGVRNGQVNPCIPLVAHKPDGSRRCAEPRETDGDGMPDQCDNCRFMQNADQADADGDKKGDVCDTKPCGGIDADLDGFIEEGTCQVTGGPLCSDWCTNPSHFDNCPGTPNPVQGNSNAKSEEAHDGWRLGDVCEPVPTPVFGVEDETISTEKLPTRFKQIGDSLWVAEGERYTNFSSKLTLEPPGSFQAPPPFNDASPQAKSFAVVDVLKTYGRYCNSGIVFPRRCDAPTSLNDQEIDLAPKQTLEQHSDLWHRMSLRLGHTTIGPNDALFGLRYGQDALTVQWDRETDWALWFSDQTQWARQAGIDASWLTEQAEGWFWTHGDTQVGMLDTSTYHTGRHPRASNPALPGEQLANHYQPLTGLSVKEHWAVRKVAQFNGINDIYQKPLKVVMDRALAAIERYKDDPRPPLDLGETGSGVNWGDTQLVIEASFDERVVGVLTRGGRVQELGERVGSSLKESLGLGGWVSQAEPTARLGRSATTPVAVRLAADGDGLVDTVELVDGRLLATADRGGCPRCQRNSALSTVMVASNGAAVRPTPRRSFEAVYSRSLGRAFVVGGTRADGSFAGDVWTVDVGSGVWGQLPLGNFAPQRVLASTWSSRDEKLWVLDETAGAWPVARLVRIDPERGDAVVVGAWPRLGLFDRYWLSLDRSGRVVLSASSTERRKYVVIIVENHGENPTVEMIRNGEGQLFVEPVADDNGWWLVTRKRNGALDVDHRSSLDAKHGWKWKDVAKCF